MWFGFWGCRRVEDGAAVGADGEMGKDVGALTVEEGVFGEGSELIGIGMRTVGTRIGGLAVGQMRAQRAGGDGLHDADPSLL